MVPSFDNFFYFHFPVNSTIPSLRILLDDDMTDNQKPEATREILSLKSGDSDNFYDSLIIQCPDGRDVCYSLRSEEELTLKSTHFLFAFLFESAPPSYLVGSFLLKLRKQGLTGLLLTLALQRQYCLHLSPTQGLGLSLERISCISRYENRSCILSYRNVNRDASG